jgi:uncharacterized protein
VVGRLAFASEDVRRQRAALDERSHRPWPLPRRPWVLGQTWQHLLFAHWRVTPSALEALVPDTLALDTWDGDAWLGMTPFLVTGSRSRGFPPVPRISTFPELNVRTYVVYGGRPGIWFLSLDADSALAVAGARRSHRLPYFEAAMTAASDGARVRYVSRRRSPDGPPAEFEATYGPVERASNARPGTLEHWLIERYCLYSVDEGLRVLRGDIHHPPWPVHPAEAEIRTNTMAKPFGLELDGDPLLHYCRRQDTVLWGLTTA